MGSGIDDMTGKHSPILGEHIAIGLALAGFF